ncbi:DUF1990 family protein [Saccharomonospora azurea]|uniref:DUF1990 family protein n=1 Tax=Saccharomonospora azurea TaxID=40988 RepID=UPI003D919BA6
MERVRQGAAVVSRWLWGTTLVTWRYLWDTTPLHRYECRGDEHDGAPPVPEHVVDDRAQLAADGHGPFFHRRFQVRIADARLDAAQLVDRVICDFEHFVPREVVGIRADGVNGRGLDVGDELLVEMPGPWNGPVRVTHRDTTSLRFVTLRGHLEAGQVEFRADSEDGVLVFVIELWARPAGRLVHLLYSHLRLAKEVQLNMWVRFCLAAVATSGGRLLDGVHVDTRSLDPAVAGC